MSCISDLIDRYWDLAYAEGRENRQHDTKNGDAQDCRMEIDDHIETLEGIAHQAGMERDELRMAIDSAEIEHGLTSNGNLWRFWSEKAKETAVENKRLRSELANARNAALEEAAALIDRTPICELQLKNEDRPERIFEIAAGTQSIHDARLVRSLKAEGESR